MVEYKEPLLQLKDVSLSFGNKHILKNINLIIRDIVRDSMTGQVITLLGKSGIGKTQLLKMIAGLQSPTSGEVLLGKELRPVREGEVGMVLQNYPLLEHRTVLSNLKLVSSDKEKIKFYAEEFDITPHINKYPCQLSGGQRQRSAIIQQLLCSSKYILFDEPFSGLDPLAIIKLSKTIQKVAHLAEDNTIIISSHILEPTVAISDMVIMLAKNGEEPATITKTINLADFGLAWLDNPRQNYGFINLCEELRNSF